jgi:hypothetical protein
LCNDEYGISFDRGSYSFSSGQYATYTLLSLVAAVDQSKVEPCHLACQVKQSGQHCQWTSETLVSPSSDCFPVLINAHAVICISFNDVPVLEHDDVYFRSSDTITPGGLYFS